MIASIADDIGAVFTVLVIIAAAVIVWAGVRR